MDIEQMADMFILFLCACVVSYYIGKRIKVMLYKRKLRLMDEQFKRRGFTLMTTDTGEQWYVGYGNPYND